MANEVEWQRKINRRLSEEGGYGAKWATPYTVGVPDLVLSVPELGCCLAEVKLERNWNSDTSRTLELTTKQALTLRRFHKADGAVFVLVVVPVGSREVWLCGLPAPGKSQTLKVPRPLIFEYGLEWYHKGPLLTDYIRDFVFIDKEHLRHDANIFDRRNS